MSWLAVLLAAALAAPIGGKPGHGNAGLLLLAAIAGCPADGAVPEPEKKSPEELRRESEEADALLFASTNNGSAEVAPKGLKVWDERTLANLVTRYEKDVAGLRTELAWLRRDNQALRSGDGVKARQPLPNPDAEHGSTMFITMCAGTVYFETYCGPLFASFEGAYGAAASRHQIVAFYTDVDAKVLQVAEERFAPWLRMVELPQDGNKGGMKGGTESTYGKEKEAAGDNVKCMYGEGKVTTCRVQEESTDNRDFKTAVDSLWFPWRIALYLKDHAAGFCYFAVMDSDMLFVSPFGEYLPDCNAEPPIRAEWDVAFTIYDTDFVVPWADDPAKVGRTKNGLTRFNCGIVLVNLHDVLKARRFMSKWAHVSHQLLTAGEGSGEKSDSNVWEVWQEQLEDDFRGNDQAGLVLLATGYDTSRLGSLIGWGAGACEVCIRPVEQELALFQDEESLAIRFRGFPARILNHPESMINGAFPPGLRMVHLKGLWWRLVLSKGVLFTDATRRGDWHREALALQRLSNSIWQLALDPADRSENKPGAGLAVFSREGKNVTNDIDAQVLRDLTNV